MASPISFLLGMWASNFLRTKFDNQLFRNDTHRLSQRWRYSFDPFGHVDVSEVLLHWDLVLSTSACPKPCWSHKCCRRPDMWCHKLGHWSDLFWMETTGYEGQKDLDMMPEGQHARVFNFTPATGRALISAWRDLISNTDSILQDVLTHRCAGAYGEHWMAWTTGSLLVLLPESPVWKKVEKQGTWWAGELKWGDTIWSSYWRSQGLIKFETQITKNAAELRINLPQFTLLWSMKFHLYLKMINQSTRISTRLEPHETTINYFCATNWQVASRIRSKYLLEEEHTASRYWTRHMVCRTIPSPWPSGGKQQIQLRFNGESSFCGRMKGWNINYWCDPIIPQTIPLCVGLLKRIGSNNTTNLWTHEHVAPQVFVPSCSRCQADWQVGRLVAATTSPFLFHQLLPTSPFGLRIAEPILCPSNKLWNIIESGLS